MKKILFALMLCLANSFVIMAQNQLTVTVDTAGTLARLLPNEVRSSISELKVNGELNGQDIKVLQSITSRARPRGENEEVLTELDLTDVVILEAKGSFRTRANQLPAAMFANCQSLEVVLLPSTLESVSKSCFSGCTNLREVVMPDSLLVIDDYAFNGCVSLTSVELPSELQKIENHAFDGCRSLTEIEIPEEVELIDNYQGCCQPYSCFGLCRL